MHTNKTPSFLSKRSAVWLGLIALVASGVIFAYLSHHAAEEKNHKQIREAAEAEQIKQKANKASTPSENKTVRGVGDLFIRKAN
jgi:hypothetical protein